MKSIARCSVLTLILVGAGASVAAAKWLPVHQVASAKPLNVSDWSNPVAPVWYTPIRGASSSNWQESTDRAFSHAMAIAGGHVYEFRLVKVIASNASQIDGLWDVLRDGVVACDDCVGKAYGLDQPVGNYFKIYVGTPLAYAERWHWSGYITQRFDY